MNRPSRRVFLAGATAATIGSLAGCLGSTNPGEIGTGDMDDELPPPTRGSADADVTLTVFEDFGCPACRTFKTQVSPAIVEEYVEPGDVRQVHRDFPIPADELWSSPVANGARAVQETGGDDAFWTFAQEIYQYQGSYSLDLIEETAAAAGGDSTAARTAADERTYHDRIQADVELAEDVNVRGTPTVFVDDEKLDSFDFDAVRAALDERL